MRSSFISVNFTGSYGADAIITCGGFVFSSDEAAAAEPVVDSAASVVAAAAAAAGPDFDLVLI